MLTINNLSDIKIRKNGVSYCLQQAPRDTSYRKHATESISSVKVLIRSFKKFRPDCILKVNSFRHLDSP